MLFILSLNYTIKQMPNELPNCCKVIISAVSCREQIISFPLFFPQIIRIFDCVLCVRFYERYYFSIKMAGPGMLGF